MRLRGLSSGRSFGRGNGYLRLISDGEDKDYQLLSLSTVLLITTDEIKRTRSVKSNLGISIIKLLYRIINVAGVVISFRHYLHRV